MADEDPTPEMGGTDPAPEKPAPRSDDDVEKLRAALRKANKEAEQHRLRLKELEDRDKSDSEKLTEANRTLEERARRAEIDLCRYRVAIRKGLTETQARRLVGDTEEDLESDADELLEAFAGSKAAGEKPAPVEGRPKERLRPGAVPEAEPDPDPAEIVASIPRR